MVDLFSGVGGFSLAAQWCWGDDLEIEAFVEIDPFCQKVLSKNFPGVPIYDDIKKIQWVVADTREQRKKRESENDKNQGRETEDGAEHSRSAFDASNPNGESSTTWAAGAILGSPPLSPRPGERIELGRIDLLTGGFPCQPFSCAGKRAGTEDDRHLWPEMLRTIHEIKPRWVVAENVPGLLTLQDGVVFEGVCADLEAEGYEVQPVIVPACAQGAPHRRDRVWIIGHALHSKGNVIGSGLCEIGKGREWRKRPDHSNCHAPDTEFNGLQGGIDQERREGKTGLGRRPPDSPWQEHWYEVATRLCRVDARIPRGVDRVNRLKALGNSIVPAIAYRIMKSIQEVDNANRDPF